MQIIKSKEEIIDYFKNGSKDKTKLKIGVEHERFLYNNKNSRLQFTEIKNFLNILKDILGKKLKRTIK